MKPNFEIIFTDIDWTLYDHSRKPSRFDKASIRELKKLQKRGIKVFFSTARPYHSLNQTKLLKLFKPDGMILANGGLIITDDKVVYESEMNVEDFRLLCELANKNNVNVEGIRTYDCFLINNNLNEAKKLFATYPENVPEVEDYHNQKVLGANLFAPLEMNDIFKKGLKDHFYYYRYHECGVDIASIPHIKGEGIKKVLKELNIEKEKCIAIGDDEADISMFEVCGVGIAMGNANIKVKSKASIVTDTARHHGVKKRLSAISNYSLIAWAGSFLLAIIAGIIADTNAVNKPKPIIIGATHHLNPPKSKVVLLNK